MLRRLFLVQCRGPAAVLAVCLATSPHRRGLPLSLLCYLRYRLLWLLPLTRLNFFVAFWELSLLALPSLRPNALLAQFTA